MRSFAHSNSSFSPQNFTFNDDFSPSSTSSADLSGLGAEPKAPGFSHSLALSSDESLDMIDDEALGITSSQDRAIIKKKLKEMKASLEKARKAQEKMEKQREKLRKKEQEQLQRKSKKADKPSSDATEGTKEQ
ncbi:neurabin-1 isoform x7 [Limosa lapponica baueri]|uniref:Neurabin-1 isoform x7 n=1 Tax=Limosa lapponica baueri TaxID=1758121 RepID=A0A2I0T6P2_LIMLA|nr:neurabin-1 isoform x7 [Limosa lapponica baueri]